MKVTNRKAHAQQRERIDLDDIRIGKDVIEMVTSGMYVSPLTIFREYVQNSADAIDAARAAGILQPRRGRVEITFDQSARAVVIRDNGAGVKVTAAIPTLCAVGASPKRGSKARGFRGVGRLSGLAYCRELQFRTKTRGDATTASLTWDCQTLRERLADSRFDGDLRRIISDVVSVSFETAEDIDDHFFEVHFHDVSRLRNDLLLNESLASHYLSQVAPLPFSSGFSYGREIEKHLTLNGARHPIELLVAGEQVFRPHRDEMLFPATGHRLRISEIEFLEFANVDGEVGAVGWVAHHEYVRSIIPKLGVRGLRARVGDLQVGDANLFDDIFKEPRFNGWSIGELHVHDSRVVPNARRDNFETNHHYYNLLVQLGSLGTNISHRCRSASVSRTAEQIVRNVVGEVQGRLKQTKSIDRAERSRLKALMLRTKGTLKRLEGAELRTQLEETIERLIKKIDKLSPQRGARMVPLEEAALLISKLVTNRAQAAKLLALLERVSS